MALSKLPRILNWTTPWQASGRASSSYPCPCLSNKTCILFFPASDGRIAPPTVQDYGPRDLRPSLRIIDARKVPKQTIVRSVCCEPFHVTSGRLLYRLILVRIALLSGGFKEWPWTRMEVEAVQSRTNSKRGFVKIGSPEAHRRPRQITPYSRPSRSKPSLTEMCTLLGSQPRMTMWHLALA